MDLKVGDTVIVSCEPGSARVIGVVARHLMVEWPWGETNPSSRYEWDGTFAIPVENSVQEWVPYHLEPAASELRAGDVCTVSIPPTLLHVGYYEKYDSPRDRGWTPAPTAGIYVVPPENADIEDAGCMLYLGGAEPIRVELVED